VTEWPPTTPYRHVLCGVVVGVILVVTFLTLEVFLGGAVVLVGDPTAVASL
jgi:hypothetical protein